MARDDEWNAGVRREAASRWLCALALLSSTLRVSAQEPPSPEAAPAPQAAQADGAPVALLTSDPVEVVVTGSRIEEPVSQSVTATEVIRRAEIERSGARNAAEILEERAGVTVTRSFAGSELWLRGLDPEYSLVLVDGDRIPGQIDGAIDLTRYGVENIERIEIVRGPGSALYGSDAIGGVVNIVSRESSRPLDLDASLSYGQGNLLDLTGRAAARLAAPLHVQLVGGYHRADGFSGEQGTSASAREQGTGGFKLTYEPDSRQRLVARATYTTLTLEGVDEGAGGAVFDRVQLQEQLSSALEHRVGTPGRLQLVSRVTYSQFRDQFLSDQRRASERDRYEDNREHLAQITSVLQVPEGPRHRSTVGLEHLFQIFDSERLADRGNRYRLAPFAQHAFTVWRGGDARFEVVPGARVDLDSQFGTQLSPKIALRYERQDVLELRASYGRGFRAPSFSELLLRFENPTVGYSVLGNPNLGAETSHGVDAGVTWKSGSAIELGATFFRNDLRDMIAIVTAPNSMFGTEYTYDNLSDAWTMGIETSAVLRASDVLSVNLGYTWLRTWNGEDERELEGRPHHRLSAAARLGYAPWAVELTARGLVQIGRQYYVPETDEEERAVTADPLAQVDVRLGKRFTRHLELAVGIDNLLDSTDQFTVLRPFTFYGSLSGRY